MSYSDLYFQERRRPPVLLVVMAVLVTAAFTYVLLGSNRAPSTRASNKRLMTQELVNVAQKQAGIFWQSDTNDTGYVIWGTTENKLDQIALDVRDLADKDKSPSKYHYVMIARDRDGNLLKPGGQYFYKIVSGDTVYSDVDNKAYSFRTLRDLKLSSSAKPAYGTLLLPNREPAQNAFVVLRFPGAYPLLTSSKLTGEWLLSLQSLVNSNTGEVIIPKDTDTVTLNIYTDDQASTTVTALVSKLNPLPQKITLGQTYSFIEDTSVLGAKTKQTKRVADAAIEFLLPKENAVIPGSKPFFKGLAVPKESVALVVNSKPEQSYRSMVDAKGIWNISLLHALPAGTYTATLITKDATDKAVTLTRNFSINKSGEQVLGIATPEATLEPSAVPTSQQTFPSPTSGSVVYATSVPVSRAPTPSAMLKTGETGWGYGIGSAAMIFIGAALIFMF